MPPLPAVLELFNGADDDSIDSLSFVPDSDSDRSEEIPVYQAIGLHMNKVKDIRDKSEHCVSEPTDGSITRPVEDDSQSDRQPVVVPESSGQCTKVFYCPICMISVVHLPRHLYSLHSDDTAVAEVMSASGARKKNLLMRLRNMGSHLH